MNEKSLDPIKLYINRKLTYKCRLNKQMYVYNSFNLNVESLVI